MANALGVVRRRLTVAAALACSLLAPIAAAPVADAASAACTATDGTPLKGCSDLSVSPPRITYAPASLTRVVPQRFIYTNSGTTAVHVDMSVRDGEADTAGTVTAAALPDSGDAASWVTISPAHFDVKAGGSQTVTAAIRPPADASAGDHQILVFFTKPGAPLTNGSIAVATQIGAQLLLQIPGPVIHNIALDTVSVAARSRLFGVSLPGAEDLTATLKNDGTVHENYSGGHLMTATITGLGAPKNATVSMPPFTMYSGQTRTVTTTWDAAGALASAGPPLWCVCHATFTVADGHGGTTVTTVAFTIVPIWQIAAGAVFLAGGVLAGFGVRNRRRTAAADRDELRRLRGLTATSETSAVGAHRSR